MTRKKVKLAFISDDSSRKTTFKKRKKGLIKKVNELSTLCGITACAIICSPYDANPEVWPSKPGVEKVISEFRSLPEIDQSKKMVDQDTFIRQRITKATDHWKRQRKDNREMEMTEVMFQYLAGNMGMFHMNILDLNDLGYIIDQYLKDINHRIEILQSSGIGIGGSSNDVANATPSEGIRSSGIVVSTTSPTTTTIHAVGSSSSYVAPAFFFSSIQQPQLRYHVAPYGGLYEQLRNENHNQNLNNQQWILEKMNRLEQVRYMGEQRGFPFTNDNHHNRNNNHELRQQQQHNHDGSSTSSAIASSSNVIPVKNPEVSKNIWFL